MDVMAGDSGRENRDVFEELLACREQVFRICLGFTRNPQDAEELAQDVYLKAHANRETIRTPAAAKSWLLRIARNTCLDHRKKGRTPRPLSFEEAGEPMDGLDNERRRAANEKLELVKISVERLPRKLKETFVLREYGELTYEEISRVLKTSPGTVMSRLNRARRALAALVEEAENGRRS